jgi:transcriptional regulator with XRE-family HTH domain
MAHAAKNNSQYTPVLDVIRAEATRRGYSRAELARLAGMGRAQVSDALAGKRSLRADSIDRLCLVLGIDHLPRRPCR